MERKQWSKRIQLFELIGFLMVILIVWLDEIFDLPHLLLNAPVTPVNYIECIIETITIALLAGSVIYMNHTLLKKILKGILPVCSFCKKVHVGDQWIPIDIYVSEHSDADLSHGLCPQCAAEHYGNLLNKRRKQKDNT